MQSIDDGHEHPSHAGRSPARSPTVVPRSPPTDGTKVPWPHARFVAKLRQIIVEAAKDQCAGGFLTDPSRFPETPQEPSSGDVHSNYKER